MERTVSYNQLIDVLSSPDRYNHINNVPIRNAQGYLEFNEFTIFGGEFKFHNGNPTFPIFFKNSTFKNKVTISHTELNGPSFYFENCTFESGFDISIRIEKLQTFKNINIHDYSILEFKGSKEIITLSDLNVTSILNIKGIICSNFTLSNKNVTNKSKIINLSFSQTSYIYIENLFCENLGITTEEEFKPENYKLNFSKLSIDKLNLSFESKIEYLTFQKSNFSLVEFYKNQIVRNFIINECPLINIEINCSNFENIKCNKSNFDELILTGSLKKESDFSFTNIALNNIAIFEFTNLGNLKFRDCNSNNNGELSIINSDLGKCIFLLCNFKNSNLQFKNSKILDIFIASTQFPEKLKGEGRELHRDAKFFYSQLHSIYKKQGETAEELHYKSLEIENYYFSLEKSKKTFGTRFQLYTSKISNNFDRSWTKGLLFICTFGFIFFLLLLISLWFSNSIDVLKANINGVKSFLKFINPIRYFDTSSLFNEPEIKTVRVNWVSYLIDFIARIILAFGYYQTIQAFRKYGRK